MGGAAGRRFDEFAASRDTMECERSALIRAELAFLPSSVITHD